MEILSIHYPPKPDPLNEAGLYSEGGNETGLYSEGGNETGLYTEGGNEARLYSEGGNEAGLHSEGGALGFPPRIPNIIVITFFNVYSNNYFF